MVYAIQKLEYPTDEIDNRQQSKSINQLMLIIDDQYLLMKNICVTFF